MEDSKESRLRAEFEAWALRAGWMPYVLAIRDGEGCYEGYAIEESWQAYRAASASRSEILEALSRAIDFIESVHDGEYGFSDCTRDELAEQLSALLAKYQGE